MVRVINDSVEDGVQELHSDRRGRRMKRLPADERHKREDFARSLFQRDPHMSITEAQAETAQQFGSPLSYTHLSAIKSAYRLVKGITSKGPPPSWTAPPYQAKPGPLPFIDVERVKEQLRAMILKGRSPQYRSTLAHVGRQLVAPDSPAYDQAFAAEMASKAPPWFLIGKRQVLLDMARRGEPRPSRTSSDDTLRALGQQLSSYITKTSTSYDAAFDKQIRELRPDWFRRNGDSDGE